MSLSYGRIIRRDVEENYGLLPESFNTYQLVDAGDIVLRLTDLQNDKRSLRVGHAGESGIITSAYLKLIAKSGQLNDRYLYRLLHSYDTTKVFYGMGGGLRQSMKFEDMRRLPLLVPSIPEQEQIANFLDHETAKIDTLIDKQQQLIKLLKEKRQAVISHAVTKGLNPDVPMKDSGVEWLGEVPECWDVRRIGTLFSESGSRAVREAELEYPILRVSIHHGISDKELDEEEMERKVFRSEDRSLYKVVHENDLAYNMMRAWQGGFGAAKVNGLISPAYVVCKPKAELNSSYFELVLRSPNAVTELKRFSRGITDFRLRLYWDEFKSIKVPIPPAGEIEKILQHIDKVNSKYDQISASAQKQIDLLIERRTALNSAAVAGKIDIRNWVFKE
ncbi:restriction endonuclease subunit S [Pelobacter seleniigenes]|uniref:restriction endonuclease subunit S n=1 Tax=Pelobacter seleniigenes TaxID=407188 RepID=UPI00138E3CD1|nr:restriction endonuclease subunit S [Pelobacter seleniigenes]